VALIKLPGYSISFLHKTKRQSPTTQQADLSIDRKYQVLSVCLAHQLLAECFVFSLKRSARVTGAHQRGAGEAAV